MIKLPILIYDDQCEICCRIKQAIEYLNIERNINFIPVSNEEIYTFFPRLCYEECLKEVHFIGEDERILKGRDVIEGMRKYLFAVDKLANFFDKKLQQKVEAMIYNRAVKFRSEFYKDLASNCKNCGSK